MKKTKKRIRRKQNEVFNRKDFNTSFFQEVIDHMDCKLKSQKLLVIPELATIYLPLYEFDCIYLHCLSRDFKKELPISTDIDTFFTIRAGSLTGSVSCIPSLHLHRPNVYHDDGYVYHIWQWTICSIWLIQAGRSRKAFVERIFLLCREKFHSNSRYSIFQVD